MRPFRLALSSCALSALLVGPVSAQSGAYAAKVVAFDTKGNAGGGIFNPANALGAPSPSLTKVHSLGAGGHLTLGFAVTITDGPGADFLVFENGFYVQGQVFAEVMFVEVSSNGTDFARFPARYLGPASPGGPFATSWAGYFSGMGGAIPPKAGGAGVDDFDVVGAGGDAFDLADLAQHPLVIAKKIDLRRITQVRLVDVVSGVSLDSRGIPIVDPTTGSADVGGVAVIHHTSNVRGTGPVVELDLPPDGDLTLTLSDPGGLVDLDPTSLRVSWDGIALPPLALLAVLTVQHVDSNRVTWRLGARLPPALRFHLAVSLKDKAGFRSGQSRAR